MRLPPSSQSLSCRARVPETDSRPCATGVNHYEVCHPLTEKYLDLLRTNRVRRLVLRLHVLSSLSLTRRSSVPPRPSQIEGYTKLDFKA